MPRLANGQTIIKRLAAKVAGHFPGTEAEDFEKGGGDPDARKILMSLLIDYTVPLRDIQGALGIHSTGTIYKASDWVKSQHARSNIGRIVREVKMSIDAENLDSASQPLGGRVAPKKTVKALGQNEEWKKKIREVVGLVYLRLVNTKKEIVLPSQVALHILLDTTVPNEEVLKAFDIGPDGQAMELGRMVIALRDQSFAALVAEIAAEVKTVLES